MKRPVVWIAAGFVVGIVIAALIPVGLYWMFLSGRAWPMALSKEIFWMVAAVFALAAILSVIGLTCLLRRTFRVWWIGAFAWALATIATGLWPLAALLPTARRLGNRSAARLAAWSGAALLLAGALHGIGVAADIPNTYWGVITFAFLGTGLVLAALRRLDGNAPAHRSFAWVFASTVVIAITTQPAWYIRSMERQADEALSALLDTLGSSRSQLETLFAERPPVAEEEDPLAALAPDALEAEQGSFSQVRQMILAMGGKRRLHPLVQEEIDLITSWFTTHTNLATAADAVSASPDYRSCLPWPKSSEEKFVTSIFRPDPRLNVGDAISHANLLQLRARAALAAGDGAAGASAAIQFENLVAQFERVPILVNHLAAIAIIRMESNLLIPRIDLWNEEDLLAMQRRADNAVASAEQQARLTLAHEMCYCRGMCEHVDAETQKQASAPVRGSRILDFWIAAECRALFRYEADSWDATQGLLKTASGEHLGDRIDQLEKDDLDRVLALPPMARQIAPTLSPAIVNTTVWMRNNAAFIRAAVAVERYRRTHGTMPPSLDDLVPDFLPSVPVNAYDGEPLAYEPGPIEIPEEVFPVLDNPDALAAKNKAEFTAEFGHMKQVSLLQLVDSINRRAPAPKPETRTLPAQTLPGFRLTMPDRRAKKRRDMDFFFYIP